MIVFKCIEGLPPDDVLTQILQLWSEMAPNPQTERAREEMAEKKNALFVLALSDERVVGFKAGYPAYKSQFFSWLGGVHPEFRRQGIGGRLMEMQHAWCREHGYTSIRTFTQNETRPMLILNLKSGFDVLGTYTETDGKTKILLQKELK